MRALMLSASLLPALCAAQGSAVLYPRHAQPIAALVAQIAAAIGPVCWDATLRPGDPWRTAMAQCIGRAQVVFIVWTDAAAASPEVGAEWRMALGSGARVVPIRLGETRTPMPPELAALEWITWPQCPNTKETP